MSEPAQAPAADGAPAYHLRLFVAGNSLLSIRTIALLRAFCATRLLGGVRLEIVDIYQQPALAREDQVIAAPTLVRLRPLPVRRVIGDLVDERRMLRALDVPFAFGAGDG